MILGTLACMIIFNGTDITQFLSPSISTPQGVSIFRVMQMFYTTGLFIFPPVLLAILSSRNPRSFLWLYTPPLRFTFIAMVLMILAIPGINLIASFNAIIPMPDLIDHLEAKAYELTKAFLTTDSTSILIINLFMVAVLPAIGEELLFRGVLQRQLCKLFQNTFWGVLVASIVFSTIHLQFHGFIPRMLLGMLFGYLLVWSGSIWVPIIVHFINNALAVLAFYYIGKGSIPHQVETMGQYQQHWHIGVISLALTLCLFWVLWRERVVD